MNAPNEMASPVNVVVGSCATAIQEAGVLGLHCRQAAANAESNAAVAQVHKKAAVQRAKAIRQHLLSAFAQVDAFIEVMDDEKQRIQRV